MRYSPGVAPPRTQAQGLAISETRGSTAQSVNGVSFRDNNFLIDGIQNNSNHQGFGVMNFPEIEALGNNTVSRLRRRMLDSAEPEAPWPNRRHPERGVQIRHQ